MRFFPFPFEELPFIVLALIISFTVHEFAHAYSAYRFGDDTAYREGRVTLNPMVHIDLFGFILILLAGFGWAKPVPVSPRNFKNPRMMSIIVSLVGPFSNLILGIISIFLMIIIANTAFYADASFGVQSAISKFLGYMISYSFLLFIFNLIPLPPLDGYRIVSELLPFRLRYKLEQNLHWGTIIFLLMVFIPPLRAVTLEPILKIGDQLAMFFITIARNLLL